MHIPKHFSQSWFWLQLLKIWIEKSHTCLLHILDITKVFFIYSKCFLQFFKLACLFHVSFFWILCRKLYGEQAKFFEMEQAPRMKHSRAGLVSMVNNGQNMHGSQVNKKNGGNIYKIEINLKFISKFF